MAGSVMFIEAESLEDARSIVENDIYYTAGVVCGNSCLVRIEN
jgi:uncharacterized protein YciI